MAELITTSLFSDPKLKSYWRFEGNSNDNSSGGFNGTDANMTYGNSSGKYGQGASFNGANSLISIGTALNLSSTDFTLVGWVNQQGTLSDQAFMAQGTSHVIDTQYQFGVESGTVLYTSFFDSVTHFATVSFPGTAQWVQVALTFATASLQQTIWQGGSIVGTFLTSAPLNVSGSTEIGQQFGGNPYNGFMDDWAVFTRVLTPTELNLLAGPSVQGMIGKFR